MANCALRQRDVVDAFHRAPRRGEICACRGLADRADVRDVAGDRIDRAQHAVVRARGDLAVAGMAFDADGAKWFGELGLGRGDAGFGIDDVERVVCVVDGVERVVRVGTRLGAANCVSAVLDRPPARRDTR